MMNTCSSSLFRPDDCQAHIYGCVVFHKLPKLFFQSTQVPGFHTLKSLSVFLFLLQSSFRTVWTERLSRICRLKQYLSEFLKD